MQCLSLRRRLLEGLDLTSTALGLLINLVEHDSGCRPTLAALPLRHGTRALPLLCRLMQVQNVLHPSLSTAQALHIMRQPYHAYEQRRKCKNWEDSESIIHVLLGHTWSLGQVFL